MPPMRTAPARSLFLVIFLCVAVVSPTTGGAPQIGREDKTALSRAEQVFRGDDEVGELTLEALYLFRGETPAGQQVNLEVLADLAALPSSDPARRFRVSLVVESRDGDTWIRHEEIAAPQAERAPYWSFEASLEVPGEVRDFGVVVEDLTSGKWGATVAEDGDERLDLPAGTAVSVRPGLWSVFAEPAPEQLAGQQASPGSAAPAPALPAPGVAPAPEPILPPPAAPGAVLRLLPPRSRKPTGSTKIETLVSAPEVAKVVFSLAGKEVATATKEPFDARLVLAGPGTPQRISAAAFAADGSRLGDDAMTVNEVNRAFRVRLSANPLASQETDLDVQAEVSVPPRTRLDRVEIYWNETLVKRFTAPPFRTVVDAKAASGSDFVRAVAYLADGTTTEDVRLVGARGLVEQVDVTLVQLFLVVVDKAGKQVTDLTKDDFLVRQAGKPQSIERLSLAEEVPLRLGLVIDTSASMEMIMNETRQAASQFLLSTLSDRDQAFLVDFSTRPRLRHRATGNVMELIDSFRGMRADGATALFDAIIFSLIEYQDGPGRRALVVLTDGDDYGSRFSSNRAISYAKRTGVPVYIIALGGPRGLRGATVMELEAVTKETGGRLYYAEGPGDLTTAYDEINRELRSQYLLTFYAAAGLDPEALADVDVKLKRRGYEARTVVGADPNEL